MSVRSVLVKHLDETAGIYAPESHADGILAALHAAGYVVPSVLLLAELADDLEAEISPRYSGADAYPSEAARKERDMVPVYAARAMIAAAKEAGDEG